MGWLWLTHGQMFFLLCWPHPCCNVWNRKEPSSDHLDPWMQKHLCLSSIQQRFRYKSWFSATPRRVYPVFLARYSDIDLWHAPGVLQISVWLSYLMTGSSGDGRCGAEFLMCAFAGIYVCLRNKVKVWNRMNVDAVHACFIKSPFHRCFLLTNPTAGVFNHIQSYWMLFFLRNSPHLLVESHWNPPKWWAENCLPWVLWRSGSVWLGELQKSP